jgi:type I restriction enzyme, S subunit
MKSATVRLADIAALSSGGTPSRSQPDYFSGEIPWVKTLDLTDGWVTSSQERITNAAMLSFRCELLPVGTVLVAMYGGSGTIGKSGILGVPAAINQALCAMLPSPTRWHSEYLHYWLQHVRPQWMRFSAGNRKDPNINKQVVANMKLNLPPLEQQSRVVSQLADTLGEIRKAIAGVHQQADNAQQLFRSLLVEHFHDCVPVGVGPLSEVPKGWRSVVLLSLARLESGHTPSRRHPEWWGGDVPWLALPDIRKLHGKVAMQTTENTNGKGLANSSARLLPVDTVCLCRDASIGFVTILGRPMATSQHFCNWICDPKKLDAEFLMYAFMASFDYLRELGSGSVLKTIYMPTIQSFHICAPDLPEQRRMARRLRERLAQAEGLQIQLKDRLAEIEKLPQRILASAFGTA